LSILVRPQLAPVCGIYLAQILYRRGTLHPVAPFLLGILGGLSISLGINRYLFGQFFLVPQGDGFIS
jgi:hypothetical protein